MPIDPGEVFPTLPKRLRNEILDEFEKISQGYLEGKWEPAELSGGKFCEVVYTVVKGYQDGSFPSRASKPKDFPTACKALESKTGVPHSMRVLIPRILPGLYDIRNNRSVGHVGGDVDPNHMDATYVLSASRWIIAELVRVFHGTSSTEAQALVESLTTKVVPIIWQVPDGGRRVLSTSLSKKDMVLLLLYDSFPEPVSVGSLISSIGYKNQSEFRTRLLKSMRDAAQIEHNTRDGLVYLSPLGVRFVEENLPLQA